MALLDIPDGVQVQRFSVEFFSPPQWNVHARIEIEGVSPHGPIWGGTVSPATRRDLTTVLSLLARKARAEF